MPFAVANSPARMSWNKPRAPMMIVTMPIKPDRSWAMTIVIVAKREYSNRFMLGGPW